MSNYNLDELAESFDFNLGGNDYSFRLPNSEEIEASQKFDKADNQAYKDWVYSFITPKTEGAPTIQEASKKMTLRQINAFNHMVETEFKADV